MDDSISRETAVAFAEHAYHEWNLAMAAADGHRQISRCFKMQELCKAVASVFADVPAADVKPVRFTAAIPSEMVRDYYGTWGECQSCGYDDNTVGAKYCGGCGSRLIWRTNNGD